MLNNVPVEYLRKDNHVEAFVQEFCNETLNTTGGIAERCDFLDRFSKVVDYKLNYLLNKHSHHIRIVG